MFYFVNVFRSVRVYVQRESQFRVRLPEERGVGLERIWSLHHRGVLEQGLQKQKEQQMGEDQVDAQKSGWGRTRRAKAPMYLPVSKEKATEEEHLSKR